MPLTIILRSIPFPTIAILPFALKPVPLPLALIVLPARVLDVNVRSAAPRTTQPAAQTPRQPSLHCAGPLHVHQYALTVYFLTVRMFVGRCLCVCYARDEMMALQNRGSGWGVFFRSIHFHTHSIVQRA